ncbi:hypothetical protein ACFQ51_21870 [Streptomyces kaempferi]
MPLAGGTGRADRRAHGGDRRPGVVPDDLARRHQVVALWRRPERITGFDGPRTWRAAA